MEPFNYRAFLPDPSKQLLESMNVGAQMVGGVSPEDLAIRKNQLELQNLQIAAARESAKTAPGIGQANLRQAEALAGSAEMRLSQSNQVQDVFRYFSENPQATISDPQVANALPLMNQRQSEALAQVTLLRNQALLRSGNVSPEKMVKMVDESILLPTQDQKAAFDAIKSLPDSAKKVMGNTFLKATGAAFSGNVDAAAVEVDKLAESFNQSKDPRIQQMVPALRGFVESVTSKDFDKSQLVSEVMLLAKLTNNQGVYESTYDIYKQNQKAAKDASERPLPVALEKTSRELTNSYDLGMESKVVFDSILSGAEKLNPKEITKGRAGWLVSNVREFFGKTQDLDRWKKDVDQTLTQNRLSVIGESLKGSSSDRDIALMIKGIANVYNDPEGALRQIVKMRDAVERSTQRNKFDQNWISEFKTTASAPFGAEIDGFKIKKGESIINARERFIERLTQRNKFDQNWISEFKTTAAAPFDAEIDGFKIKKGESIINARERFIETSSALSKYGVE